MSDIIQKSWFTDVNTQLASMVKSVNGNTPDSNGNLTLEQLGYLPLSGGTMTGAITFHREMGCCATDDSFLNLRGGTSNATGARMTLNGKDRDSTLAGGFALVAQNGTTEIQFIGKPDGNLAWNNKAIERVDVIGTNYVRFVSGLQICWATFDVTSTSGNTITFPKSFTAVPSLAVCVEGASAEGDYTVRANEPTTTNFLARVFRNEAVTSVVRCKYIAIGK